MELFEALDELVITTRFSSEGAFDTQSSNHRFVQFVLDHVPFSGEDVFVDVGCGVGGVLSLFHDHLGIKVIGVEIDPIIAEMARERVRDMDNVEVVTENILNCKSIIQEATVFYLYNPFNASVLDRFLELVGSIGRKDVRVIYVNDIFKSVFEKHHWKSIIHSQFARPDKPDLNLSVWIKDA